MLTRFERDQRAFEMKCSHLNSSRARMSLWLDENTGFVLQKAFYDTSGQVIAFSTIRHFKANDDVKDIQRSCDSFAQRNLLPKIGKIGRSIDEISKFCDEHEIEFQE